MDSTVKEIELIRKSIDYMRSNMAMKNEELDDIIIEKQKKLNQVETTIVLKVSQLKNECDPLSKCIVLPSSQFYWLNNRTNELNKETETQRKRLEGYDKTLSKVKNENMRLEEQYKNLLGQVNEATIKKYGRLVNIAELEEAVLQALIHEVRMDVPNIVKSLDTELKKKQVKLDEEKKELLKLAKNRNRIFEELVKLEQDRIKMETEIDTIQLRKKIEQEKHTHTLSDYERDISKLSTVFERLQEEEALIMKELCDLTYKGTRPPIKLPPIKRQTKVRTKTKEIPVSKAVQLQNANKKVKEILQILKSHDPNVDNYTFIINDLKELYGLHLKGADETVDDVVDVMIDLASKSEESNIGVSNSEVIQATLSMLLLDIEQTESQIDDAMSIQSDISGVEEDNADIIKVSVQADEGEHKDEINEFEEFVVEEEQQEEKEQDEQEQEEMISNQEITNDGESEDKINEDDDDEGETIENTN